MGERDGEGCGLKADAGGLSRPQDEAQWQNGLVTAATAVIVVLIIISAAAMIGRTVIMLVITAASLVVTAVIIGGAFPVSAVGAAVPIAYKL